MFSNKSIFIVLLSSILFATGCSKDQFVGSDNIVTISRELPAFTRIVAESDLDVNVTQSSTQKVEIMVNDNLQEQIQTTVRSGTLDITLKNGSYDNESFIVNIQIPNLESLRLDDNTRANVTFSGDLFEFEINDSSELELVGSADILNTTINDDGRISAFSFTTSVLNTTSKDAAELQITCTNELNGTVQDASQVSYRGMPVVNAQTSDAGQIIDAN